MAVLCGWAAQDEHKKARGGKAGDQTGREVHLGDWYDFGQTAVYRWKNRAYAAKYATIIKALCQNDKVGYDQGERTTLYNQLKANKWDYKKITKACECDCSSLVGAGINATVGKALISTGIYTGNLDSLLMKTGLFTKLTGPKYCDQSAYLMTGDIINNPSHHVISALANGSKATSTSSGTTKKSNKVIAQEIIEGKWGNGAERIRKVTAAGYNYDAVQKEVNALLKKPAASSASTSLKTAKVTAKKGLNVRNKPSTSTGKVLRTLPLGTKVTCYGVANGGGRTWWKISKSKNEYVAAEYLK